jgi:Domain of unknown function (DUF4893)
MKFPSIAFAATATMLLGGCAMMAAPTGTISRADAIRDGSWQSVATPADRARIRDWWPAWQEALASARSGGHGDEIAAQGALLEPLAALPNPHIPPGTYRCRTIKLGSPGGATLSYVAYPYFQCRVEAEQDMFSLTKLSGSQRQTGLIFDDNERRKIFLGTLALGDEARAMDYGADADRNVAGAVERIGPMRWRIVFPRPAFESIVDVMELIPEG